MQRELSAVLRHYCQSCAECAKAVADAKGLSLQLAVWQAEEAPEQLTESVHAALAANRPRRNSKPASGWWTKGRVLAYGFGGALAILALLFFAEAPSRLRSRQVRSFLAESNDRTARLFLQPVDAEFGPKVIRTVQLTMVANELAEARAKIEAIVRDAKGYIDHLSVRSDPGSARSLSATLRFPADKLDAGLIELRKLGSTKEESQNSSDVTGQYVDLVARLNNARNAEQRLLALLRDRTGNLKDIVAAEGEIARVREQIEQMEAERKGFDNKVQYATVQVELSEEYHAQVQPGTPGAGTRIHNAAVEGYAFASETILGIALSGLTYGPALIIWLALLFSVGFLGRKLYKAVNPSPEGRGRREAAGEG